MGRWSQLLAFVGLTGFAVSQPLLSVLGDNPSFFAFRNIEGVDLVWFAVAVALVPPLVVWTVTIALDLVSPRLGRFVHVFVVGLLVALTVIQIVKSAGLDRGVLVGAVALAAGVGGAAVYERVPAVGLWARYTAILPVVAVLSFLFLSDTADLLRPPEQVDEAAATEDFADLPPVVLVVLDELPTLSLLDEEGAIDRERFPSLAAFADDATWYRDFTTMASFTTAALPSLLTGRDPTGAAPIWANYPDNLFSMLAPTHHLTVFESPTELCGVETCGEGGPTESIRTPSPRYGDLIRESVEVWRDRVSLRDDDLRLFDDFLERVDAVTDAPSGAVSDIEGLGIPIAGAVGSTPSRLVSFIDTFTASEKPTLYFMHILLPHVPWLFYEDGTSYSVPIGDPPPGDFYPVVSYDDRQPWTLALSEQRHLLQAEYTDRLVGLIVDTLKSRDMYDESLVVFVADHGITFDLEETNGRSLGGPGLPGVGYTPLLVKLPGQSTGAVTDENLMMIDLVPTIADAVGVPLPATADGHPAGSPEIEQRGGAKYTFVFRGLGALTLEERREFDAEAERPDVSSRWIAPASPGAEPLDGLWEMLDLEEGVIGGSFDDLVTGASGTAEVFGLGELRQPPPDDAPLGILTGRVTDGPTEGTLVVAVDDTVIAGSPLYDRDGSPGTFATLIPSGTLADINEIRIGLVLDDGGYRELELVES